LPKRGRNAEPLGTLGFSCWLCCGARAVVGLAIGGRGTMRKQRPALLRREHRGQDRRHSGRLVRRQLELRPRGAGLRSLRLRLRLVAGASLANDGSRNSGKRRRMHGGHGHRCAVRQLDVDPRLNRARQQPPDSGGRRARCNQRRVLLRELAARLLRPRADPVRRVGSRHSAERGPDSRLLRHWFCELPRVVHR